MHWHLAGIPTALGKKGNKWNRDLASAQLSVYLLLLPLAFTAYIRQQY